MSTSESGPPPQHPHPRRLVLRRKASNPEGQPTIRPPAGTASPSLSTLSASLTPAALPPPAILPRAERRIDNAALLDESSERPRLGERLFEPRDATPAAGLRHVQASSIGSVAKLASSVHGSAAPAPLPSRVSVLPFVASVAPDAAYETGRHTRPGARRRSGAAPVAFGLAAAFVAVGAVLAMRMARQSSVETSVAASQPLPPNPPSAAVQAEAPRRLPAIEPAVPEANVNDLPRAPPIKRAVVAGSVRPARPSVASVAKAGPPASAEAAGASASEASSASPQGSSATAASATAPAESAAAAVELPEMPPAALPPVDPLVKAVQQSIDEAHQKQ
jgi:hypothetical protein